MLSHRLLIYHPCPDIESCRKSIALIAGRLVSSGRPELVFWPKNSTDGARSRTTRVSPAMFPLSAYRASYRKIRKRKETHAWASTDVVGPIVLRSHPLRRHHAYACHLELRTNDAGAGDQRLLSSACLPPSTHSYEARIGRTSPHHLADSPCDPSHPALENISFLFYRLYAYRHRVACLCPDFGFADGHDDRHPLLSCYLASHSTQHQTLQPRAAFPDVNTTLHAQSSPFVV